MKRTLAAALVVLASAHAALAAPPSIKLTKKQIAAAAKAALAKIKPDAKRSKLCMGMHGSDETTASSTRLIEDADCLIDAGNPAMAIHLWNLVLKDHGPEPKDVEKAMRSLGPAYESIASFPEAAQAYQAFAKAYPKAAEARDQLVRAICTWAELGRDDYAASNLELLTRVWPKPAVDADHLCDTIRPIQPPAP
jgi:hypothetical protein